MKTPKLSPTEPETPPSLAQLLQAHREAAARRRLNAELSLLLTAHRVGYLRECHAPTAGAIAAGERTTRPALTLALDDLRDDLFSTELAGDDPLREALDALLCAEAAEAAVVALTL